MKAFRAAGPAIRRRLTPPDVPDPTPVDTVAYRDEPELLADVWAPEGATGAATALVVHGGGFVGGSRNMTAMRTLVAELLAHDMVVASIDYRLALPWTRIRLDEQVDDVRRAGAWWRKAAGQYGGDVERNLLVGVSAGGALSLLASEEVPFARYLGIYGAYDLTQLPARWASASLLLRTTDKAAHDERSPIHCADFDQPALLIHGTADPLTPPGHAERLLKARLERGQETHVHWVAGGHHGFLQDGPGHPHVAQSMAAVGRFVHPL